MNKIKVAVMFGGQSVEHEISVITALQACESFDFEKYQIIKLYVSKSREIYFGKVVDDIANYKSLSYVTNNSKKVLLKRENANNLIIDEHGKTVEQFDIAYPIVHGANAEGGTFQGYLEFLNIPYAGTSLESGVVGQDKIFMKRILQAENVPVIDGEWFNANEYYQDSQHVIKTIEKLKYPVIIKPAKLGSSIGIKVARNREELVPYFEEALNYDDRILVEKAIVNLKEFNCSVLGDANMARTSYIEEVRKNDEILSFADKYQRNSKKTGKGRHSQRSGMASLARQIPAKISKTLQKEIEKISLDTFRVLANVAVVRIDFIYDEDIKKVYVNEINTIPGSLSFYLWEHELSYSELLDEIIKLGISKEREKTNKIFSFETNVLENLNSAKLK